MHQKGKTGSEGFQRVRREDKLKERKAAGADQKVNVFMKVRGRRNAYVIVMLYNWTWKNENAPKRSTGVVLIVNYEEARLTWGTIER